MTQRRQWLVLGAASLVLLGGLLYAMQTLAPATPYATIGEEAPDFAAPIVPDSAPVADGPMRTLADYRDRVVLLNFWATWCEPCKVEMPSMEALHRDFARHGLSVVAVSEDNPAQVSPADLRAYADALDLTFDILRDTSGAMTRSFQVIGYPTTFIIARDGTVRRRWVGPEDWNSPANRALMRDLLGLEASRS